ncbi:MAG: UvrD-helicase domain-containing protein [Gammaproteobacteria bacterium]|nr:UvrD-helicase domain-containing protein [Gammaproteobacteria bacterium]
MVAIDEPVDAKARRQALDIATSFAVSAPAGSGKTGLLTQRLLKLLGASEQPEEVLAITFTRKAAGEMRERLLTALVAAQTEPEPQDPHGRTTWQLAQKLLQRDAQKNWQLLQNSQRLRIQTIDGLCRYIASQLPFESGLGSLGEPLAQPGIAYELAVVNLLKQLDSDTPAKPLKMLLLHLDNNLDQLSKLLQILLATREQWLGPLLQTGLDGAEEYFHLVIEELVAEALSALHQALGGYAGELLQLADYAATNLQSDNPAHPLCLCRGIDTLPQCTSDALPQWLALTELLVTASGSPRKPGGINKKIGFGLPAKNHPQLEQAKDNKARIQALVAEIGADNDLLTAIAEVRALPAALIESQWQLLQSLGQLLPLLVAELKLVFQQLGATDFSEVAQAALMALGASDTPTDLALKLDLQIRHVLVDEFQDTSQLQLQLLEKLTAGWEHNDGRSLFIVGDGMQSCYGFRNANVGIFLDARRQGIGQVVLSALDLQVNFRSGSTLVDWVNGAFIGAFPQRDNISRGAVCYRPSAAFKLHNKTESAVQFYGCIDDDERQQEASQIVTIITELQRQDSKASIAILVRQKKHLEQILPALNRAAIAFQAADLSPLASKMVVLDLLSLVRALLDPSDRISWLALLRAPWCGLTLCDLHAVANWHNEGYGALDPRASSLLETISSAAAIEAIELLSADGKQRLMQTAAILTNAWQERARKPLRIWIEGVWLSLGGPATVADKKELDNVRDFFLLLEQHDEGGVINDWQRFQQALDTLFARPGEQAQVQVMTIHKSKGLEFDHVLIPGLDHASNSGGDQLLRWCSWLNQQGENRILLAPKSPRDSADPLYDFIKHDNSERERLEGTRLLYVGCTRAIHSLHLLAKIQSVEDKKPAFKPVAKASLLASLWPIINDSAHWCNWLQPSDNPVGPKEQNFNYFLRLPQPWQGPAFPHQDLLAHYRTNDYQPRDNDEANLPELDGLPLRWMRHAGTVAHEALAMLATPALMDHDQIDLDDPPQLIARIRPLWRLRLAQLGLSGSAQGQALEKVVQAVLNTLSCATGRWILNSEHHEAASELELHTGSSQLRRYIIDRTFIDERGKRWIIDYKTAEPTENESEEEFVARQLEKYRKQLQGYRRLFYQRGEQNICCGLYFPLLQKFAEISG